MARMAWHEERKSESAATHLSIGSGGKHKRKDEPLVRLVGGLGDKSHARIATSGGGGRGCGSSCGARYNLHRHRDKRGGGCTGGDGCSGGELGSRCRGGCRDKKERKAAVKRLLSGWTTDVASEKDCTTIAARLGDWKEGIKRAFSVTKSIVRRLAVGGLRVCGGGR